MRHAAARQDDSFGGERTRELSRLFSNLPSRELWHGTCIRRQRNTTSVVQGSVMAATTKQIEIYWAGIVAEQTRPRVEMVEPSERLSASIVWQMGTVWGTVTSEPTLNAQPHLSIN